MAFEQVTPSAPMTLHVNRSPDALSFLPPNAADRLRALRQHVDDLLAVVPVSDARLATTAARLEAEKRLSRLRAHPHQGGFDLGPGDARVVAAHEQLDKVSADAKRVDDLYQQRSTAWRTASHVQSNVERWLREAGPLADHETPLPTPVKGENNLLDQIENRRRRVRELRADLHRVRSSCYPSAYCKQRLRAQIEELAERGAPSVSALIEHDGEVIWPTTMLKARVHATEKGAVAIGEMIDVPALLAWIMVKDAGLLKRLDGLIESECDDKAALSHEAREKAEAELLGDLLAVERDEATLMFKGWAEGLPVEPRADLDPVAVLNVVLVNAHVSRGTSPERVATIGGVR